MGRFNTKPPAPEKGRVCLFVNPDTYRKLKAECVLRGTNVSKWFDDAAEKFLARADVVWEWDSEKHRPSRKRACKKWRWDGLPGNTCVCGRNKAQHGP